MWDDVGKMMFLKNYGETVADPNFVADAKRRLLKRPAGTGMGAVLLFLPG